MTSKEKIAAFRTAADMYAKAKQRGDMFAVEPKPEDCHLTSPTDKWLAKMIVEEAVKKAKAGN